MACLESRCTSNDGAQRGRLRGAPYEAGIYHQPAVVPFTEESGLTRGGPALIVPETGS